MEGVADYFVRDTLTAIGGIDKCVSEFIRVSNTVLPRRVFLRQCPELNLGTMTPAGTPITLQFLGSHPEMMAANACKAVQYGATAIDINFGCPAKMVNRNLGGAILLTDTETVFSIVQEVRRQVPKSIPVSVKMRLGYEDKSLAIANAQAIEAAGASFLTIHARTKTEGYLPPAYWEWIGKIKNNTTLPLIANGEIWSPEDYRRCKELSGCENIMLGRGLLSRPDLALQIKDPTHIPFDELRIVDLLIDFQERSCQHFPLKFAGDRLKQWLAYLKRHYAIADQLFDQLKRLREPEKLMQTLLQARLHLADK